MTSFRNESAGRRTVVQMLLALLCLTLVVQGCHVCPMALRDASRAQVEVGAPPPVCTICAITTSLLVAVVLILTLLVPTHSHTEAIPVQAQAFWDGLRLYVRPPPALR